MADADRIPVLQGLSCRSVASDAALRTRRDGLVDFIQVNYSLEQREAADRLLPLAADRGMAVMINRAFGGGRIFEKVGDFMYCLHYSGTV